ncbi:MAG TPA: hypothetical protein VKW04_23225 [Planctomycetota bacterium]|nr:hypothetical protein [Planctomycetota bacterium]
MSIRGRSILGALALFGGILLMLSGTLWKSSDRIRYQRDLLQKKVDPPPPQSLGGNVAMIVGLLAAAGGAGLIGVAIRDVTREIDQAGSNAERSLQRALQDKSGPDPKP